MVSRSIFTLPLISGAALVGQGIQVVDTDKAPEIIVRGANGRAMLNCEGSDMGIRG
jgi:hypothetical protein